ncbi:hypothetical protein BS78_03G065600 [Paspalum vaginatum]|nr:hypothetical protein BS78_03G065600 [Paspalum vaginatum]
MEISFAGSPPQTHSSTYVPGRASTELHKCCNSNVTAAGGQNLGAESGSRKRKAGVMSKASVSPADSGEHLEVECEDSRIKKEIEDLRSQIDDYVKELGYCDENEDLRVELALKTKEMQCLGKQNEELEAKNYGLLKQNEELQAKNDVIVKRNEDLQAKNDGLVKQSEDLQAKNDGVVKQNEELQAKNNGLVKQNEKLHTKNDILREQNGELQAKNGGLSFQNEELRGKNDDLTKQNGELQAKNDGLWKWNEKVQSKNDSLKNRIEEQNDGLMKRAEEIGHLKAQVIKLFTTVNQLMANNSTLVDTGKVLEEYDAIKEEVAAYAAELKRTRKKNKDLSGDIVKEKRGLEGELNGQTTVGIKRMGELDEKPFQSACKRKHGNDYQTKSAELVSVWQEELKKPSWHPFKIVKVNGEDKEVLDEDDAKLNSLQLLYGDEVCNAVKTALVEMKEYSPSERYVVPAVWNFRKGRKATMREVLKYKLGQLDMKIKHRRG